MRAGLNYLGALRRAKVAVAYVESIFLVHPFLFRMISRTRARPGRALLRGRPAAGAKRRTIGIESIQTFS